MKDLGIVEFENISEEIRKKYRVRKAARAIVKDGDGKIALLSVTKHDYHKLPGGGIKEGEDLLLALKRECLEEIGCEVEIGDVFATIQEWRDEFEVHQFSTCYAAKVVGEKGQPDFTQKELDAGFEIIWVNEDEVVAILENDEPNDYQGKFIKKRDLLLFKEFLNS